MGKDILTVAEITGMRIADTVHKIFSQRQSSENWAKWSEEHLREAAFLEAADRIWQATQSR